MLQLVGYNIIDMISLEALRWFQWNMGMWGLFFHPNVANKFNNKFKWYDSARNWSGGGVYWANPCWHWSLHGLGKLFLSHMECGLMTQAMMLHRSACFSSTYYKYDIWNWDQFYKLWFASHILCKNESSFFLSVHCASWVCLGHKPGL